MKISFDSLMGQLEGIQATVWIFDNGSDLQTKRVIAGLQSSHHRIHKVSFPVNMGLPYAVNIFARVVREECAFTGLRAPTHVMIMDCDAYFKAPLRDLLDVHCVNTGIGLLSGHDSQECPTLEEKAMEVNGRQFMLKRKEIERMITMIMSTEEFLLCYPIPHYRQVDVDWEITQWNTNSMLRRRRGLWVACGYVLHLGIWNSSWSGLADSTAPAEEIAEVRQILASHGITAG